MSSVSKKSGASKRAARDRRILANAGQQERVGAPISRGSKPSANQQPQEARREVLRSKAARVIAGTMGEGLGDVAALSTLSEELLLLSHYCGIAKDRENELEITVGFLEEALLRMSECAYVAINLPGRACHVARESAGKRPESEAAE